MIFHPQVVRNLDGCFIFSDSVSAKGHPCLNTEAINALWKGFTYQSTTLTVCECKELVFSVGNAKKLPLNGYAYTISVSSEGIFLNAKDEQSLLHAFMTLADRMKAVDREEKLVISIDCCEIYDSPKIQNRMVHFCIFPETELWELHRFVRLCGALKYTHIILEFWGMLKYDCLKELAWPDAFSKEEIRPILREARELGMEIIPMFNHWGHASAGRVMHGKHVVLDQNPGLQTYFSEDGWCWDIRKEKVRALLRSIREELIELCGSGRYFHIGCDEAYNFSYTEENMKMICAYLNDISDELLANGRRAIVWGDMFLYRHETYCAKNNYTCQAPSLEVEKHMLDLLKKDIVIADWQYSAPQFPVETALTFKKQGFDCMLCPWDEGRSQLYATIDTVSDHSLMGYIHTTWHTLSKGMPYVMLAGAGGYSGNVKPLAETDARTACASLLRKVMPVEGNYKRAGWSKFQVECIW